MEKILTGFNEQEADLNRIKQKLSSEIIWRLISKKYEK